MPLPARREDYLPAVSAAKRRAIDAFDRGPSGSGFEVRVAVLTRQSNLSQVSRRMEELDRELRRVAGMAHPGGIETGYQVPPEVEVEGGPRRRNLPPPLPPDHAGLEVRVAIVGSLDLLTAPIGALELLLLSQPALALAQALTYLDAFARLRGWIRPRGSPLDGLSLQEGLEVLQALRDIDSNFDGVPADLDLELGERRNTGSGRTRGQVQLPDGTWATGRRVIVVREHKDGGRDILVVDG